MRTIGRIGLIPYTYGWQAVHTAIVPFCITIRLSKQYALCRGTC